MLNDPTRPGDTPARPTSRTIRSLAPGEHGAAAEILVEAFDRDPFGRWLYPDEAVRRARHRTVFTEAVSAPEAIVDVTEDLDAVAVWHAPGTPPSRDLPPNLGPDATALFRWVKAAIPSRPHWYLAFLGARTPGAGGGSALLRHRLATIRGPVALWTANPANLAFYGRFGFAVVDHMAVPGAAAWWLTATVPPAA